MSSNLDNLAAQGNRQTNKEEESQKKAELKKQRRGEKNKANNTNALYMFFPGPLARILFATYLLLFFILFICDRFNLSFHGRDGSTILYNPKEDHYGTPGFIIGLLVLGALMIFTKMIIPATSRKSLEKEEARVAAIPFNFDAEGYFKKLCENGYQAELNIRYVKEKAPPADYVGGIIKALYKSKVDFSPDNNHPSTHIIRFRVKGANEKEGYNLHKMIKKITNDVLIPLHQKYPISRVKIW